MLQQLSILGHSHLLMKKKETFVGIQTMKSLYLLELHFQELSLVVDTKVKIFNSSYLGEVDLNISTRWDKSSHLFRKPHQFRPIIGI